DLGLLATVGPRTIHVYDKLCVVVLSTDSGKVRDSNKIMLMKVLKCTTCYLLTAISRIYSNETEFNQSIDPRPEYIRVIIIECSIHIVRTVSLDTQRSLISARRCKDLDGYNQQVY
ncbi:unnamed protein product, partial [Rotaria magnacalcarata]